jgi:hypothetical protein
LNVNHLRRSGRSALSTVKWTVRTIPAGPLGVSAGDRQDLVDVAVAEQAGVELEAASSALPSNQRQG